MFMGVGVFRSEETLQRQKELMLSRLQREEHDEGHSTPLAMSCSNHVA